MPYLVDGHNLIPKAGLRLGAPDDELKLVALLQDFARLKKQQVEVYFDGAPPGQAGSQKIGSIRAHFIKAGYPADDAIRARLGKMGRIAKDWVVVSSDREVQNAARAHQAQVMRAEEFAKLLRKQRETNEGSQSQNVKLSEIEVEKWLELFEGGDVK